MMKAQYQFGDLPKMQVDAIHADIFAFAINVNGEKLVIAAYHCKRASIGGLQRFAHGIITDEHMT